MASGSTFGSPEFTATPSQLTSSTVRRKVMENNRLPSNASTALETTSKKCLSPAETMHLDKLMLRTSVYYPSQELSKETLHEFRDAYQVMALRHGVESVEAALRELRLTSKFFPHPAEINDVIIAAKELEQAKGRWARQETYMREKAERERVERETSEYVDMSSIVKEFYEKKGVMERPEPIASTEGFTDPHDRVMASFSRGLEDGKQYEPAIVEQIIAWRKAKSA